MPEAKKPAAIRDEGAQAAPRSPGGDVALLICDEVTEPLTALAQYLHVARQLQRDAESGDPLTEILVKAEAEVARAGDLVHRLRRHLGPGAASGKPGEGG